MENLMKKTSYWAISLIAAGLSVSAQAQSSGQTIAMYINSTTTPIDKPSIPPTGGTSSSGGCAFRLKTVSTKFDLPSGSMADEPIVVTKALDNCSHFWFPVAKGGSPIQTPFPVAAIYIYQGITPALIINLTNVYVRSLSFSMLAQQNVDNQEEWQLVPTTITIIDKVANTSVTCDYMKKTCT
jgi:hypothetical protein